MARLRARATCRAVLALLALVAAPGCDRKDAAAELTSSSMAPSSVVSASEAPSVAPSAAPSVAPSSRAGSPLAPSAAGDAGAAPAASSPMRAPALAARSSAASARSGAVAAGAPGADASDACGTKPLPDCPLQAWMKRTTVPAMASNDLPTIAGVLDQIADLAPPPPAYANWVSIARDGASAARAGNIDAVKGACRGCHDQYRAKYRAEDRARPVPSP